MQKAAGYEKDGEQIKLLKNSASRALFFKANEDKEGGQKDQ